MPGLDPGTHAVKADGTSPLKKCLAANSRQMHHRVDTRVKPAHDGFGAEFELDPGTHAVKTNGSNPLRENGSPPIAGGCIAAWIRGSSPRMTVSERNPAKRDCLGEMPFARPVGVNTPLAGC